MAKILDTSDMFFTSFEPKVKNRFVMYMNDVPAYMIKMANRPSINFETITIDHINLKRKLQGKGEWQDITISLYDPIVPSAAQAVMEWVRLGHESLTGRRGYADFYKKDLTLNILGPVGDIVGEWIIKGAFLTKGDFGQLDWTSTDGIVEIGITVAMDYCVLNY